MTQTQIPATNLPKHNYRVEPELQALVPRAEPAGLREASAVVRQDRRAYIGLFGVAAALLLCSVAPGLRDLGPDWLPLNLIQLAAIAVALVNVVRIYFGAGSWGRVLPWYVHGEVIVGQVEALDLVPVRAVPGVITGFQFHATVNFLHPDNALPIRAILASPTVSTMDRHRLTTSFRVGDSVTLLWRWDRSEDSLRLYDFLGIRRDKGLVPRPTRGRPAWLGLATWGGLATVALGALVWVQLASFRYPTVRPIMDHLSPVLLGVGLVAIVLSAVIVYAWDRRQARRLHLANLQADAEGRPVDRGPASVWSAPGPAMWLLKAGLLFSTSAVCATLVAAAAITLNARLDPSPGREWRAAIESRDVRTHSGVFNEYIIYYRFQGEDSRHRFYTDEERVTHIPIGPGRVIVKDGYFQWPWVKDLRPTALEQRRLPPPGSYVPPAQHDSNRGVTRPAPPPRP